MRKHRDSYFIPLKVVRRLYDSDPNAEGAKPKCKKITRMIEYFDRHEICKIEPVLNANTWKKAKSRCMIFYKPNGTYYEIAESIESVYKKIHHKDQPITIGFKYKR